MTTETAGFAALQRAQLTLWEHAALLWQQSVATWAGLALHLGRAGVADAERGTRRWFDVRDAQMLADAPTDAGWTMLRHGLLGWQACAQTALGTQAGLAAGWHDAVGRWQRETALALSAAAGTMPLYATARRFWGVVPNHHRAPAHAAAPLPATAPESPPGSTAAG
jgi:hypothetical protein